MFSVARSQIQTLDDEGKPWGEDLRELADTVVFPRSGVRGSDCLPGHIVQGVGRVSCVDDRRIGSDP